MAIGLSVNVGVNQVNAPGISVPALRGCENDARAMHKIAIDNHFISDEPLINETATFDRVFDAILDASQRLESGDIFLFTFAGHGTRHGSEDINEIDSKDETLVLNDKIMIDNVLRRSLWPNFKEGVRVIAIADSCFSGGVFLSLLGLTGSNFLSTRANAISALNVGNATSPPGLLSVPELIVEEAGEVVSLGTGAIRAIPVGQNERHFEELPDFYRELRERVLKDSLENGQAKPLQASFLFLSACSEDDPAADGENGAFTKALLEVWEEGGFQGSYDDFITRIKEEFAGKAQRPGLVAAGKLTDAFRGQRPFTI